MKRLFLLLVAALALLVPVVGQAASGPELNFYAPNTTTPPITTFGYGPVLPGQSVSKTFPLKNTGGSATAALKITLTPSAGTPASAFTKTGDTCTQPVPISLGKGKTCQIEITFTPVAGGVSYGADLTAVSKKPNASRTLHLTGSGAAPNVQITPASKDFGSLGAALSFTATNTGTAASGAYVFDAPGAPFSVSDNSCTGASLGIGASCSFAGRYQPSTCGGDASYADTAALGSFASVSLTASEPECPHLVVSPSSWDFGTASGTKTFIFTNDGEGPARFTSGAFNPGNGPFDFAGFACSGVVLQPGESCNQDVGVTLWEGCGGSWNGSVSEGARPAGLWGGGTTTIATATFTAAQPACPADLSVSLIRTDQFSSTLTVSNAGPGSAEGVIVDLYCDPPSSAFAGYSSPWRELLPQTATHRRWEYTQPIASGQTAAMTVGCNNSDGFAEGTGHVEISASSAPDPDSTPNNGVASEDDYAAMAPPG